jgi:DNA polymerase iota
MDPRKENSDSITAGSEDVIYPTQIEFDENGIWEENEDEDESREKCAECGAVMPAFAMAAHERFHTLTE